MNISDYKLEMELGGVDAADIAEILKVCEEIGFDADTLDAELIQRGYEPLFGVLYDAYDDFDDWEDDEYAPVQRFPSKKKFRE